MDQLTAVWLMPWQAEAALSALPEHPRLSIPRATWASALNTAKLTATLLVSKDGLRHLLLVMSLSAHCHLFRDPDTGQHLMDSFCSASGQHQFGVSHMEGETGQEDAFMSEPGFMVIAAGYWSSSAFHVQR